MLAFSSTLLFLATPHAEGQENAELLLDFEIAEGTRLTVEVPGEAPMTTEPRGFLRSRMQLPLNGEALLDGQDIVGTFQIEEMLVAATPFIVRERSTGVGCITLDKESSGTLTVNAAQGSIRLDGVTTTRTRLTDRVASDRLGDFVLSDAIQATIPVTLEDLLTLAGGGSPNLEFSQAFDAVSNDGNRLDGTRVRGLMRFRTASPEARSNPNLDVCREFLMRRDPAARRRIGGSRGLFGPK